jgi:hypothetical protein
MRLPYLVLPLFCLAGCMSEAERSATSAPASPSAPAVAAPAAAAPVPSVSKPAAPAAPTIAAAPAPAPVVVAAPAPQPVSVDLAKVTGPTENSELFGYDDSASRIFLYGAGTVVLPVTLTGDGEREIAITAACDEADGQKAKFSVAIDGQAVGGEITCTTTDSKEYVITASGLKAGNHQIAITFLNDLYKENEYDLNFYVHGVTVRSVK